MGVDARDGTRTQRRGVGLVWSGLGVVLMGVTFLEGAGMLGGPPALGVAGVGALIAGIAMIAFGVSRVRMRTTAGPELEEL
jgi:hypothetical protein